MIHKYGLHTAVHSSRHIHSCFFPAGKIHTSYFLNDVFAFLHYNWYAPVPFHPEGWIETLHRTNKHFSFVCEVVVRSLS